MLENWKTPRVHAALSTLGTFPGARGDRLISHALNFHSVWSNLTLAVVMRPEIKTKCTALAQRRLFLCTP